jgi:hypothetical protein
MPMTVQFRIFKSGGMFSGPEGCLKEASEQAAKFAESLSPDELVGFSQAFPIHNMAYVTVWYRTGAGPSDQSKAGDAGVDETMVQEWLNKPSGEK